MLLKTAGRSIHLWGENGGVTIMPGVKERDYYARRATGARERANAAVDPELRAILEKMAQSYERLVEEADRIVHVHPRLTEVAPSPFEPLSMAEHDSMAPVLLQAQGETTESFGRDATLRV